MALTADQPATDLPTAGPGPGYPKHPGYKIDFTPCAKRLRIKFAGATVVDTTAAMLLHETAHIPVYYVPRDDVRLDLLTATDHTTNCPFKGDAAYWSVSHDGRTADNAVWSYPLPYDEVPQIRDYMGFYWNKMDSWWEEDEEVFVHARDPHVRVDILPSSRRVQVTVAGQVVADTTNALFLFETGLPTRYYIPQADVRMDHLKATPTRSSCPYKGDAEYWSVTVGGRTIDDIAWSYPAPVRESAPVKDHICFFNEHADAITIDGKAQPKPVTKWS